MPSNGSLLIDWRVVNGFEAMAVGYFLDVNLGKGTDQWSFLSSIDSSVILSSMANNVKDSDYQYRDQYTADGYIIGQNSNLTNGDLQYANIWTQSIESHLSKWDGKDDLLLANQIWDAVFDSPRNRILPTESTVSKKGGYVFWAQDLEFDISATPDGLKNQFKGMIALLWAGRKVLGDDFKIIPIVSNSIQRNWDGSRDYVDISALIDSDLKKLGLSNLASRSDGRSWNLMSYLKENKLIDGFIGEGYKKDFVGQLDPDSAPFKVSQNLAYAVLGNWTKNLEQASKPIKSDFYGSLPMNAGGYFTDKAPAEKFKSSSFDPVPKNLLAYNASKPQIQNNTQIVDLTDLSVGETAQLQVSLSRDADYTVQAGQNGAPNSCQPEFQTAGLTFGARVSKIDDNGFVSFALSPSIAAVTRSQIIEGCGPVSILSVRRLDTGSLRVRDGQTLILTGVISDSDSRVVSKWPILGDIPLIGQFFRQTAGERSKRELVILVTPRIIDEALGGNYGYGYRPSLPAARQVLSRP